jgi:hypothetical protein
MNVLAKFSAVALAAAALAPSTLADGRTPGSLLVYPVHNSNMGYITVLSVTNTKLTPVLTQFGNVSTNVHFEFVNALPTEGHYAPVCAVNNDVHPLTPADTLSFVTRCKNGPGQEGYVVATAQDPAAFDRDWNFNHLIGSELVITPQGGVYALNAISFKAVSGSEGSSTDLDGDSHADFDGAEYEGIPDELYIDSNIAVVGSSLALINLTGGTDFTAFVKFDAWNDNEKQLSATLAFKCWAEVQLDTIGGNGGPGTIFNEFYLFNNTLNDFRELDTNCDGIDDVETSWARITGINATSNIEGIQDPALLGAITGGSRGQFAVGRLLWESDAKQLNGDFLNLGGDDPEN